VTIGNYPFLTGIKALGTAKLLALLPGSLDTLVRALADQAALKLGIGGLVRRLLTEDRLTAGSLQRSERSLGRCTTVARSRPEGAQPLAHA
jgi:hypothetical protein